MLAYRHAFHAGNHADVLKHLVLIATLRHLQLKEPAITLVDTHAGAGLYRLDGDFADKGGEAEHGVVRLFAACRPATGSPTAQATPPIDDYLDLVAGFNPSGALRVYPGSPFVVQRLMRHEARDRALQFGWGRASALFLSHLEGLSYAEIARRLDVSVSSVTKYLAGHSDVVLGAAVTSDPDLRARLIRHQMEAKAFMLTLMRAQAEASLARWKQPRHWQRLDALPRGANNKLNRRALAALYRKDP